MYFCPCETIAKVPSSAISEGCEVKWCAGCLTSQSTIFKSYMWRYIDVQADLRRSLTYGRSPNAIDIS